MSDEEKIALAWMSCIEGDKAQIRETDIYPRLKAWVEKTSPREILELGCGQGVCSEKINLIGRNYTGLELSALLVHRAQKLYGQANRRFIEGDIYKLPFADDSFDAIFAVSIWHLLKDLGKATKELARVLKPGGSFLIISANPAA